MEEYLKIGKHPCIFSSPPSVGFMLLFVYIIIVGVHLVCFSADPLAEVSFIRHSDDKLVELQKPENPNEWDLIKKVKVFINQKKERVVEENSFFFIKILDF